ncbi:hypothetical protein L202_01834 [Cryptococcus amylolentus CBS 6039]|uniref:Uncharacterized protein n=1 Tax=Cryptococcus amylolentus CBS 6039 TaxID=1295533 RepID=A0A1E3I5C4_9TREE|nr:hypothetical protein L202_01834 [Cryptococcus amylolentus CBS 6039]ODN83742.1 hypothetical protein L202_01834 [Cryptococcus amylolentus CBS 6039]
MPPSTANTDTSSPSTTPPLFPAEVEHVIYDSFLSFDPSCTLARTLTLAKLSKSHHKSFIPPLYKRIVVSDKAIERGLFEGLSARPASGTEVVRAEGGPLGSKRDLLEHCESLVFATLAARDATAEVVELWNGVMTAERYEAGGLPDTPGIFNNVAHIAFESDCLEQYAIGKLDLLFRQQAPAIKRHPWPLKNLSHICFRLPYPSLPSEYEQYLESLYHLASYFAPGVNDTVGNVTRFQNHDMSEDSISSINYVNWGETMIVDMLPLEHSEDSGGVEGYGRHVELIYTYCKKSFWIWGQFGKKCPEDLPKALILTNFGTTVSRDGNFHYISPNKQKAILQKAQKDIRTRLQSVAASENLDTGVVDKIFIRGHEECEFCGDVAPREYEFWDW